MPVLKTYKNGKWVDVSGMSEHTHTKNDITDFPSSLPANGGNADTLDGKHADEFALASDLEALQTKVGDTSVSEQINTAFSSYNADWNASEGEEGYILNKPEGVGYDETKETVLMPETTIEFSNNNSYQHFIENSTFVFKDGTTYKIIWDGVTYTCEAFVEDSLVFLGNTVPLSYEKGNGEPFGCVYIPDDGTVVIATANTGSEHTVTFSINEIGKVPHKIPSKYIPTPNWESQEDEEGYIEGRTHYKKYVNCISEATYEVVDGGDDWYYFDFTELSSIPTFGKTYVVNWNGAKYECECKRGDSDGSFVTLGTLDDNTVYPFYMEFYGEDGDCGGNSDVYDGSASVIVTIDEIVYEKISDNYLPIHSRGCVIDITDDEWGNANNHRLALARGLDITTFNTLYGGGTGVVKIGKYRCNIIGFNYVDSPNGNNLVIPFVDFFYNLDTVPYRIMFSDTVFMPPTT